MVDGTMIRIATKSTMNAQAAVWDQCKRSTAANAIYRTSIWST